MGANPELPYRRQRWGRGFTYRDSQGKTVQDPELRGWLASLPIPPAWVDVEIAAHEKAKVLATGRDSAGRKQYLYSPTYRAEREREKYSRIVRFAERLESMRRTTGQHLRELEMTRQKVLACMVRLLDLAYFRPGNPYYTEENDSYGLTTMRSRHLSVHEDELLFCYKGKSGIPQERCVRDERLATVVAELDEIPGYRIFKYFERDGTKRVVDSEDLNDYIREVMGEDFSAKDFRTWAGTAIAALALDELGVAEDPSVAEERVRKAVERVAQRLGNTTSVARTSYIAPKVIESYLDGRTTSYFLREIDRQLDRPEQLSLEELGLLHLLKAKL